MSICMLRRSRAALSMAVAMMVSSLAGAKPPDLPALSRETVAPQAGSRQVEIVVQEREDKPLNAEQLTVMPTEVKAVRARPAAKDDPQLAGARRLYLIGERCRREGDLDMAVNCYHETHLLCPKSAYGRKARQRLQEIEARRVVEPVPADAEEQEPPRAMPQHPVAAPDNATFPQSRLPHLDEDIMRALEEVLNTIAAPKPPTITIELEEAQPAPEAAEEQEPPLAPQLPVLRVPLPPRNLTIYIDEPETYGATSSLWDGAESALRVAGGLDLELELASGSGGGMRARGSIQAGNLGCKVIYQDSDGHYTLTVVLP